MTSGNLIAPWMKNMGMLHQIPIAVFRVEFHHEAADVTSLIG
jgi:hypothetical protein